MRRSPGAGAPRCQLALAPRGLSCRSRLPAPLWVSHLKGDERNRVGGRGMLNVRDAPGDCGFPPASPPRHAEDGAEVGGEAKGAERVGTGQG